MEHKQILIIGMDPHTIDFSLPGFLPGMTADKVEKGIEAERKSLLEQGYATDLCLIDSANHDLIPLEDQLKAKRFDGIMIGAGIRIPPVNFILFEQLMNVVHQYAGHARIAFNTNPTDTLEAIKRWV
jgi:hypothetical protein